MYRAREIGWLALESLARQRNVDFEWELIVIEERFEALGESAVREFEGPMQEKGLRSLRYFMLDRWIPLAHKWHYLARLAQGEFFVLQAADCFSPPTRLKDTFMALHGAEWVQQPLGPFVDLATQHVSIFDYELAQAPSRTALNMGTLTGLARLLPKAEIRRYVDNWFFTCLEKELNRVPLIFHNESTDWRFGLDTHGLNNISLARRNMLGLRGHDYAPPFRAPRDGEPRRIADIVPAPIAQKIEWLENAAKIRVNFGNICVPGHEHKPTENNDGEGGAVC